MLKCDNNINIDTVTIIVKIFYGMMPECDKCVMTERDIKDNVAKIACVML